MAAPLKGDGHSASPHGADLFAAWRVPSRARQARRQTFFACRPQARIKKGSIACFRLAAVPTALRTAVPTAFELAVPTACKPTAPVAFELAVPTAIKTAVPTAFELAVPTALNPAAPVAFALQRLRPFGS